MLFRQYLRSSLLLLYIVSATAVFAQMAVHVAGGQGKIAASRGGNPPEQQSASSPVAGMGAPVLGYLPMSGGRGLYHILGAPGSALMRGETDFGRSALVAAFSANKQYALVLSGAARAVSLYNLRTAAPGAGIAGINPGPDKIVLSPSGAAAALYYSGSAVVATIAGLPEAPVVGTQVDLSSVTGSIDAFAVSDDAQALLFAVGRDGAESLYVSVDAGPRLMSPGHQGLSLAFLWNSHDAIVADVASNTVLALRDLANGGNLSPIAGEQDGIRAPIAVATAADNTRVFAANSGTGTIAQIDLAGLPPVLVDCRCKLAGLYPLAATAFRVAEPAEGVFAVFDAWRPQPRMAVVPFAGAPRPARVIAASANANRLPSSPRLAVKQDRPHTLTLQEAVVTIDNVTGCATPSPQTVVFPTDAAVTLWLLASSVSNNEPTAVIWTPPNGISFTTTAPGANLFPPGTVGDACYWHTIKIAGNNANASQFGNWTAALYNQDGTNIATQKFTLTRVPSVVGVNQPSSVAYPSDIAVQAVLDSADYQLPVSGTLSLQWAADPSIVNAIPGSTYDWGIVSGGGIVSSAPFTIAPNSSTSSDVAVQMGSVAGSYQYIATLYGIGGRSIDVVSQPLGTGVQAACPPRASR